MDPNLITIRQANMRLIKKGKIRLPKLHARDYLTRILGEYNQPQIDKELAKFEDHLKITARKYHGKEKVTHK